MKSFTNLRVRQKICRIAGVCVMAFNLLSCSGNSESGDASTQGTPANPYTIIWYSIGTPQKDTQKVIDELNKYLIPKIGAKVDLTLIDWGAYDQRLQVITMSGQPYDIAFTATWADNFFTQAQRGAFYPLNDLLQQYGQGILKSVNPLFLEGIKLNGEIYGIPTNKEIGQQSVIEINADLMKKLGFKLNQFKPDAGLDTFRSLEPFLAAVKRKYPEVIPMRPKKGYNIGTMLPVYYEDTPGLMRFNDPQHRIFNEYEDPEYTKYFSLIHEFYLKGYIPADSVTTDFQDNVWGLKIDDYSPFAETSWSANFPVKVIPYYQQVVTNDSVSGSLMAISVNARRPDIDMKFLNLINSDPYVRNLIENGIQNVHYKKIAPNVIEYLPAHQDYTMPGFTLGNVFLTYIDKNEPLNKWQVFESWNKAALASPLLGFRFDPTPVQSEYVALKAIISNYKGSLFVGEYDPKIYLPKLNAELKAAGLAKFIAEEQRQFDVWYAKTHGSESASK